MQDKFHSYLLKLSESNQVILSTRSLFFFKNSLGHEDIELLISKKTKGKVRVENTGDDYGLFPWSPSCGEINYQAYGVETVEFHNELYGTI